MMWAGWGMHWIWMVAAWAAVIGVVVWAIARVAPRGPRENEPSARTTLDERYARGEIDDDEYRLRRAELRR